MIANSLRKIREKLKRSRSGNTMYAESRASAFEEALEIIKEERDEVVADIRNKLTPISSQIEMSLIPFREGVDGDFADLLEVELLKSQKCLKYILKRLSGEIAETTNLEEADLS